MKINKVFAFVSVEENGDEGICAAYIEKENYWLPLITGNEKNLNRMTVMAEDIKRQTGGEIKLIEFSTRTEIKTL